MLACDRHQEKREAVYEVGGQGVGGWNPLFKPMSSTRDLTEPRAIARHLCQQCVDELGNWLREEV